MTQFRTLTSIILTGIIAIGLTGCGKTKSDPTVNAITPIEGWDITLPSDAEWNLSQFSGLVENHEYTTTVDQYQMLAFLETAMKENGWLLNASGERNRDFVRNGDSVQFIVKGEREGKTPVFIIIEPKGAYDKKEVTKQDE